MALSELPPSPPVDGVEHAERGKGDGCHRGERGGDVTASRLLQGSPEAGWGVRS